MGKIEEIGQRLLVTIYPTPAARTPTTPAEETPKLLRDLSWDEFNSAYDLIYTNLLGGLYDENSKCQRPQDICYTTIYRRLCSKKY